MRLIPAREVVRGTRNVKAVTGDQRRVALPNEACADQVRNATQGHTPTTPTRSRATMLPLRTEDSQPPEGNTEHTGEGKRRSPRP